MKEIDKRIQKIKIIKYKINKEELINLKNLLPKTKNL
jgi:hypothetical protein